MRKFVPNMDLLEEVITVSNMNEIADAVSRTKALDNTTKLGQGRSDFVAGIIRATTAAETPRWSTVVINSATGIEKDQAMSAGEALRPVVACSNWDDADQTARKPWGLLLDAAQPGTVSRVLVFGITACKVTFSEGDTYAKPSESGLVSTPESGPVKIIWVHDEEDSDGKRWAVVHVLAPEYLRPMPFDLALRVNPNDDEEQLDLYLYVGSSPETIVRPNGSVKSGEAALVGGDDGWAKIASAIAESATYYVSLALISTEADEETTVVGWQLDVTTAEPVSDEDVTPLIIGSVAGGKINQLYHGVVSADETPLDNQSLEYDEARRAQIKGFSDLENSVEIDLEKPPENAEFLMRVTNGDGATIGYFKVEPEPEPEPEEPTPPPCGHPGNASGAGMWDGAGWEKGGDEHPGDFVEDDHPGDGEGEDGVTPESGGCCEDGEEIEGFSE